MSAYFTQVYEDSIATGRIEHNKGVQYWPGLESKVKVDSDVHL